MGVCDYKVFWRIWDIKWNAKGVTYADVFKRTEKEYCAYNFEYADTAMLIRHFNDHEQECLKLIEKKLAQPAYDQCLKAGHIFNLLEARGVISVTERASYIAKIRNLARKCCEEWVAGMLS